jgi:predicted HD superfamily hydrolase involved in NAD metabolism
MAAPLPERLAAVQAEMRTRPAGLIAHVERVEAEALALAATWDLDPQRMTLAVWGHDLFRHAPAAQQLTLAEEAGVAISTADRQAPIVLHGPTAAAVLEARFSVRDAEVLGAVREHTLGSPSMTLLGKVLLLADKFESVKRERDPHLVMIREAARRDLDLALLCWADFKWVEERSNEWDSHPGHWGARLAWVREHHADAAMPARVDDAVFETAATE